MIVYNEVLRFLLKKDYWKRYNNSIDFDFLKGNLPELYKLFKTLEILHRDTEDSKELSPLELQAGLFLNYPNIDKGSYTQIFTQLEQPSEDSDKVLELLNSMRSHSEAAKLGILALDVAQGKRTLEALNEAVAAFEKVGEGDVAKSRFEYVTDDLEELLGKAYGEGGLNWRLGSLNRSLGPLRVGDMGFFMARPEVGKTTFLADQVTNMVEQVGKDEHILWINNEEQGEKVKLRCYSAGLGVGLDRILANKGKADAAYKERFGDKLRLYDSATTSKRDVEAMCKELKPRLVVFDQLPKIKGFSADRDDLVLGAIYQWARELAKVYAPVIGVCQAGGEAEGVKYLNMGHVANAKTSVQAEADWILGIGLDYNDPDFIRGFSISKNKLLGGPDSDPKRRHARWEVMIEPEIGRYRDLGDATDK